MKKAITIFLFIFTLFLILFYQIAKEAKTPLQEDLIFFQFLNHKSNLEELNNSNMKNNINYNNENFNSNNFYKLKVEKQKENSKEVHLMQTVDTSTLVHKKVAPGTKGVFEVILVSNQDLNYEINLEGKNQKPKNLEFKIEDKVGIIKKNEKKKIVVSWEWKYEINEEENKQDTKDGMTLENYEFIITTKGY